jgi:hypothetical protein
LFEQLFFNLMWQAFWHPQSVADFHEQEDQELTEIDLELASTPSSEILEEI